MAEDKLGRFMKDKVYHHPSSTDAEALWEKIQSAQAGDKTSRRKGGLWMWRLGIALFLLLGLGAAYWLNPVQEDLSKSLNNSPRTEVKASPTIPTVQEKLDDKSKEHSSQELNLSSEITKTPELKETLAEEKNTKSTKVTIAKNTQANTSYNAGSATTNTIDNINITLNTKNAVAPVTIEQEQNKLPVNESSNTNNATSSIDKLSAPKRLTTSSILPILNLEPLFENVFPTLQMPNWESQADYRRTRNAFNYSVGLSLNYGASLRKLTAKSEEWASFQDLREKSETRLEVIGAGLDFQVEHSSGLYGKIGLEYEQINERFDFNVFEEKVYIDENQLLKIIYDENGVPTEVYGPGEVREIFTYRKKVYNSYRMVDVPLIVGYRFGYESFGLFMEAGVAMNVLFSPEGELFAAEDEPVKLSEKKDEIFKSNVGLSILGGIGLSYQLSDKIQIYASPRIKLRPDSFTIEDYPLEQRYINTSIQLGMRYQWSDN